MIPTSTDVDQDIVKIITFKNVFDPQTVKILVNLIVSVYNDTILQEDLYSVDEINSFLESEIPIDSTIKNELLAIVQLANEREASYIRIEDKP